MRRGWLLAPIVVGIIVWSLVIGQVKVAYGTDVNPSDGIVKGVWKIIESPFLVKRDITVPTDESLTIEPGVTVYFDGYYSLTVRGKLVAAGTYGNRITFCRKDGGTDRDGWLGIYLYSATRASTITYCDIMNAKRPINVYGSFNNILTFNTIRYNSAGILISAAEGNTITDNELYEDSDYAICIRQGCQRTEISRNVIYKIGPPSAPYNRGDAIIFNGTIGGPMNIDNKIRDNKIYNCHWSAIRIDHVQNMEITGNLMYANYQRATNGTGGNVYLRKSNDTNLDYENKDIVIHNNKIHSAASNGTGIFMQSANNVRITYNDIYLNDFAGIVAGPRLGNVTVLCQINRNDIRNNRVYQAWDNGTTMAWDDGSRGNYWSDYKGYDANNDGIGDTPYLIPGPKNSKDYFPLMNPLLFLVATISTTTSRTATVPYTTVISTTTTTTTSTLSTWSATTTVVPATSTSYIYTANATTTTTGKTETVTYTISLFTFYATSTSYIWTVSMSTSTTFYSTSYTSTTTTTTTTSTSTSISTTISTTSTTTTTTTSTTRVVGPGRCVIASAAYGSELSPCVQFLREFRDDRVANSFAGSQFMKAFNTFYYSFSPSLAELISTSDAARAAMRVLLSPLLGSLSLGQAMFDVCQSQSEIGVLMAGLLSSSLLGLVYASPIVALGAVKADDKRRKSGMSLRPLALVWFGSLLALGMSYLFLYVGQTSIAEFVAMVSTGTLVLSTMIISPLLLLRLIRRLLS